MVDGDDIPSIQEENEDEESKTDVNPILPRVFFRDFT